VVLAGATLALFFGGRGDRFGALNDLFSAIALLLLIPSAVAVYERLHANAGWLLPITVATLAGLLLAAVGQLLLVARVIDLSTSFMTGGLGILPVLGWVIALVWLSLGVHLLPDAVGWLGVALLGSAALTGMFSVIKIRSAMWACSVLLLASLLGWLVALGLAVASPGPRFPST
jgi:hypothetical protein